MNHLREEGEEPGPILFHAMQFSHRTRWFHGYARHARCEDYRE